ncbi:MAG: hypothetical protein ACKPES_02675, partial [Dolichospermum sp.]
MGWASYPPVVYLITPESAVSRNCPKVITGVSALMRYILSPLSKSGEGVGGGVTLYLITSVSAVLKTQKS